LFIFGVDKMSVTYFNGFKVYHNHLMVRRQHVCVKCEQKYPVGMLIAEIGNPVFYCLSCSVTVLNLDKPEQLGWQHPRVAGNAAFWTMKYRRNLLDSTGYEQISSLLKPYVPELLRVSLAELIELDIAWLSHRNDHSWPGWWLRASGHDMVTTIRYLEELQAGVSLTDENSLAAVKARQIYSSYSKIC
jgi:hypothetical protein